MPNDFGELAELPPSAGIHAVADGSTTVEEWMPIGTPAEVSVPVRGEGADSPKAFANTRFVVHKGGTLFVK